MAIVKRFSKHKSILLRLWKQGLERLNRGTRFAVYLRADMVLKSINLRLHRRALTERRANRDKLKQIKPLLIHPGFCEHMTRNECMVTCEGDNLGIGVKSMRASPAGACSVRFSRFPAQADVSLLTDSHQTSMKTRNTANAYSYQNGVSS
jgi:hypothetical protein